MELVLASRNAHKLREFERLLGEHRILPLPEDVELPPETGSSFVANARIKALAAVADTRTAVLADDSGIEARALNGAPGIRSARFAGERASDEQNLTKLIAELEGQPDRAVAYVCAIVCVLHPGAEPILVEERCEGTLATVPVGDGGFGYDPAFIPADGGGDDGRSMAQLSDAEKDAISHRGRAARALAALL